MTAKYYSLAVSGQCCAGKYTLCEALAERTGWTHIDVGSKLRGMASAGGIDIDRFGSLPDKALRQVDDEIQRRMEREKNKIWDGRLTCYLARRNSYIFKVWCKASLEARAARLGSKDNVTIEEARTKVLARDSEEIRVFARLYGVQLSDSHKWVDIVLDLTTGSPEHFADIVRRRLG